MPDPSNAPQAGAFLVLHYGNVWQPKVDDSLTDELDLPTASPQIGPPLFLMYKDEGRTINGEGFNYGTVGLKTFTQSSGGIDGTRWIRVVNRTTTGESVDEPIQMSAAVVNDNAPSFDLLGWSGALQQGGFGGHRIQVVVHDPNNIFGTTTFVTGRQIVLHAEEYENGSLVSSVELFSGFVDAGAQTMAGTFRRQHRFTASTIERLMGRAGMDGRYCMFVDADYEANNGVIGDLGPIDNVTSGLMSARPYHIISQLNVAKVVSHVMANHLWVDVVGGSSFRLLEVCDLRVPWWNIAGGDELQVPLLGLPPGNVLQALAGMFTAQHNLVGYSFRTSDFTVAPDHEFADVMDSPVDSLSNFAYEIATAQGDPHPCGQVHLVQASLAQAQVGVGVEVFYPTTRDSTGSIVEANMTGVFYVNVAAAERMGEGIYRRENARVNLLTFKTRGAAFDLHNLVTYAGESWSIISVDRSGDWDWLGPIESTNVARMVG
jgi:hypothetical protein